MIDMFALLVSSGMIAIVVFFAVRLNREREWFERPQAPRPPVPHPSARPADAPGARGAAAGRAVRR